MAEIIITIIFDNIEITIIQCDDSFLKRAFI